MAKQICDFNVAFIGCGAVNFGGAEGPWNHSQRIEKIEGVNILGISDIDEDKAKSVLEGKLNGINSKLYSQCKLYKNWKDMLNLMSHKLTAVFIGVPPYAHGKLEAGYDMELQCLKHGINVFVEKPLSVYSIEEVETYNSALLKELSGPKKPILSVGYMFRYHPAIIQAKKILDNHAQPLLMISARYNCTYSALDHPFWWNKNLSGGPIVEQATHFCDLIRFFGGEVNFNSITSKRIIASSKPGYLGYLNNVNKVVNEDSLSVQERPPRVTISTFYYENGAVGSLTHGLVLQGFRYEACIDMWCDGLRITLEEPYFNDLCKLRVRQGNTNVEKIYTFPDADCYMDEDKSFFRAIIDANRELIKSPYHDAFKTYQLSVAISNAENK